MVRTVVGYAGGTSRNPTYRSIGDHAEAIQVEYDPGLGSYEELLDVFWAAHDPTRRAFARQYMSGLWWADDEQRAIATASRAREAARAEREIVTEMGPLAAFYAAEGYHQKYRIRRQDQVMRAVMELYPDEESFVRGALATKINGFLGGHGTPGDMRALVGELEMGAEKKRMLLALVGAPAR